jgi:outer membrane protein OmpA-like peptidoglycan-associated protein
MQPPQNLAEVSLGDAPSGPAKEDKRDRAVTLYLKFSVTIEDLFLFTDDWTHHSILRTEVVMKPTGKGEIDAYPTNWWWKKDTLWAEATVLLYNFDVNGSDLKKEHLDFLNDQVVFFLDDGPDARVKLVGTASLSGESGHNEELSANRAKAVMSLRHHKRHCCHEISAQRADRIDKSCPRNHDNSTAAFAKSRLSIIGWKPYQICSSFSYIV